MPTRHILPIYLITALFAVSCQRSELVLTQNEASTFEIATVDDKDTIQRKSAQILQEYIRQISGVEIPITSSSQSTSQNKVWIGTPREMKDAPLSEDEIAIKVLQEDLVITGGDPKSTLYATYTFLEEFLGCRFLAPDDEFIPRKSRISLDKDLDFRYKPEITTRTVHSRLYYENPDFADKRKVTYEAFPDYVPNARVHTFHRFLPADIHLDNNPEYYALRNGRRIPTQLCLTNEDVFRIVRDTVASLLKQFPDSKVISVSQDDNTQYCQCDACMAINNEEESPAGSVIAFVNRIAEVFPDKMISTLAYQYTRKAPKNIKPADNVLITLCSIECDRSAPISEKCADFYEDLVSWGKLTDNIRIWDYTTQFTNFLAPFPNIHTLQPNIRLFRENNARWIFEQHSHNPSELFELRSYLTAKLLWDPDLDQDAVMNEFLEGYYHEAAPYILNYINTVHQELQKDSSFFLFLYGDPSQAFDSFLSPDLLMQFNEWYDQAENAVVSKPEVLQRVKRARLSIDYASLEASRKNMSGYFSLTKLDESGEKSTPPHLTGRLENFDATCRSSGITLMNEMGYKVDEYVSSYRSTLTRALDANLASGKPVKLLQKPKKYANEDPQTLTDAAFGGASFYANWLGFEGNDLEAVIDLENEESFGNISSTFLQVVNHIVFFPTSVDYHYSKDGVTYTKLGTVKNARPLTKSSRINDTQSFSLSFTPVNARYVKIVGNNMSKAPIWHHGAGLSSWIFVDEVMIK